MRIRRFFQKRLSRIKKVPVSYNTGTNHRGTTLVPDKAHKHFIRLSICLTRIHVPDYCNFTRTTQVGKFISDISQTALSASRSFSLERWFCTTVHHQRL